VTAVLAGWLAVKEMVRNVGRFASISAIIALITVLILFLSGLGEGLALGNRQFVDGIDADLLVFQRTADLQIAASQFDRGSIASIRRVDGIEAVGAIAFASTVVDGVTRAGAGDAASEGAAGTRVSLLGVEPGRPGAPTARQGPGFSSTRANEVVLGRQAAIRLSAGVGDTVAVRSTQGAVDERYELRVVGIADGQQYQILPSLVVPLITFDRVKPKADAAVDPRTLVFNLVAVRAENGVVPSALAARIEAEVRSVSAVDRRTTYENIPGYSAQKSTVETQTGFTLVIGILVVGGFFQIQTLQKLGQIGMLKAIGASNALVAVATVLQIVFTNLIGVAFGALGTALLAASFPATVPIVFQPGNVGLAVGGLLVIGPVGGLVALRAALRVEPLMALGLGR
jgi:putative ABC transport system permease protein